MKSLLEFVSSRITNAMTFSDGAAIAQGRFPLVGVETSGSVLFADLPSFSSWSSRVGPVQSTYAVNHFFTWFEGETSAFGGIIDKFIGDEIMVIFLDTLSKGSGAQAAFATAHGMLDNDPYSFAPRIGIASGPLFVGLVGTGTRMSTTVIGETVNTAARFLSGLKEVQGATPKPAVCVGAELDQHVRGIVDPLSWSISAPRSFPARNMRVFSVIDITRTTDFVPQFDYWESAQEAERLARTSGSVITDMACESEVQ